MLLVGMYPVMQNVYHVCLPYCTYCPHMLFQSLPIHRVECCFSYFILSMIYYLSPFVWEASKMAFRDFQFFLIGLKVNPHFWSTKKGWDSQMWFNALVLSTFLSVKLLLAISAFHFDVSCVWCHLIHFQLFCISMQLPPFLVCPTYHGPGSFAVSLLCYLHNDY